MVSGYNFAASTYRNFFKNAEFPSHIKENFNIDIFCQSKYENSDRNMLNRIRNSFIQGINKCSHLPKLIVLVLDDDIIEYIDYEGQGLSTLIGMCVEWLCKEFEYLVKLAKKALPAKAVRDGYPQIYWVAPPHHKFLDNHLRTKMTNVLEVALKDFKDIRLIRMKEKWNYNNDEMVNSYGQFTEYGWCTYWSSVDAAVKFNLNKREIYLANQIRQSNKMGNQNNVRGVKRPFSESSKNKNEMEKFFKRNKNRGPNPAGARKLPTPRK